MGDRPLVQEDWHIVVISEFNSPLIEILQVPVVVELHLGICTLVSARAIFFDPSWIKSLTSVAATVLGDRGSCKSPIVRDEVIESVDDVVHTWQVCIVGKGPQLIIIPTSNHAGSS